MRRIVRLASSSDEDENNDKTESSASKTPVGSGASHQRGSVSRSSTRLEAKSRRSAFTMPDRKQVFDAIESPSERLSLSEYRPRKLVNDYMKVTQRYNYDVAHTSGESDEMGAFIEEEFEYLDDDSLVSEDSELESETVAKLKTKPKKTPVRKTRNRSKTGQQKTRKKRTSEPANTSPQPSSSRRITRGRGGRQRCSLATSSSSSAGSGSESESRSVTPLLGESSRSILDKVNERSRSVADRRSARRHTFDALRQQRERRLSGGPSPSTPTTSSVIKRRLSGGPSPGKATASASKRQRGGRVRRESISSEESVRGEQVEEQNGEQANTNNQSKTPSKIISSEASSDTEIEGNYDKCQSSAKKVRNIVRDSSSDNEQMKACVGGESELTSPRADNAKVENSHENRNGLLKSSLGTENRAPASVNETNDSPPRPTEESLTEILLAEIEKVEKSQENINGQHVSSLGMENRTRTVNDSPQRPTEGNLAENTLTDMKNCDSCCICHGNIESETQNNVPGVDNVHYKPKTSHFETETKPRVGKSVPECVKSIDCVVEKTTHVTQFDTVDTCAHVTQLDTVDTCAHVTKLDTVDKCAHVTQLDTVDTCAQAQCESVNIPDFGDPFDNAEDSVDDELCLLACFGAV